MNQIESLFYLTLLMLLIFAVAVILWKFFWLKPIGVEIPIDRQFFEDRRPVFYATRSFSIFWSFFSRTLRQFNRDYWSLHVGLDGFLYLLFQRALLKLMLVFALVSLLVSMPINYIETDDSSHALSNWFERTTLNNKPLTSLSSWIHVGLVGFYTMITLLTILSVRQEAKGIFVRVQIQKSKKHDHEWLKAHTLHVRGLLPQDKRGEHLKTMLNEVLGPFSGRVVDLINIPNFEELLELEGTKQDLEDLR